MMTKPVKSEPGTGKSAENGSNNLTVIQNAVKMENYETFTLEDEKINSVLKALAEALKIRIVFHTLAQNGWYQLKYNSL